MMSTFNFCYFFTYFISCSVYSVSSISNFNQRQSSLYVACETKLKAPAAA